jgi:hypothetical protein
MAMMTSPLLIRFNSYWLDVRRSKNYNYRKTMPYSKIPSLFPKDENNTKHNGYETHSPTLSFPLIIPQKYGLKAAFSDIERLFHSVTSSGSPIKIVLRSKYKVKGIGSEHTIDSVVSIYYDKVAGKIEKVEDRWHELPDIALKNVSSFHHLLST